MEPRRNENNRTPICFLVPNDKRDFIISAMKEYGAVVEDDDDFEVVDTSSITPGDVLKGIRYSREWTQVQLAEKSGISQRHISQMENGKLPIGKARAKRLAEVFGSDYRMFL